MVDSDLLFGKEIIVYTDQTQFILGRGKDNQKTFVSFNKDSHQVRREPEYNPKSGTGVQIYSVVGIIHAKSNYYLIGVSKASFIGKILTSRVFKIEDLVFVSNLSSENGNVIPEEDQKYISMMREFLQRNNLFFSDGLDLTVTIQNTFTSSLSKTNSTNKRSFIFPNTVHNFCWNYNITRVLDAEEMRGFIHPVINGYVGVRSVSDYAGEFDFLIIARKDWRRSGMRFLVRGNDKNGFSANFAETEEIVIEKNKSQSDKVNLLSFLQLRGSIPLLWTQAPNLQLNPLIVPRDDYSENSNSFRKHIVECVNNYGKIVLVNLIDKKNDQKNIGEYYHNLSKELKESKTYPVKDIEYAWFDFHAECKGMKYQNLSKLLKVNSVSQALNNQDFFHAVLNISNLKLRNDITEEDVNVVTLQKGVFRTNCIDSLDRTNVVQTVFARQILHKMLFKLGLCDGPSGEPFQEFNPVFEIVFKIMWADHGDHLAKCYSGTGALKSDFVRTGKRSKKGAIQDGINTSKRFFINNFCDGYNQDCHDYFLGKLNPKKEHFKDHSTTAVKVLTPAALLLVFALYHFLIGIAFPVEYEDNMSKRLLKFLIFLGVFFLTFKTTFNTLKKSIIDTPTLDHS